MAISARCKGCGVGFKAKDTLAGKKVKCPKCAQPILIPKSPKTSQTQVKNAPAKAASGGAYNPLLDLLDEVEVKSVTRGPVCPSCNGAMTPNAVVCVECGYNVETGEQLKTAVYDDDDDEVGVSDLGMTDADRIMAKAEQDIDDMPVTAHGQDFGDGADSFVIAGVAGGILLVLVGIGLTIIFTMDIVSAYVASWFISFIASVLMAAAMIVWITIVAFMQKPGHGIACICTAGLWCVVFGFMQGKQLLVPTVILLFSLVIGLASGAYTMYAGMTPTEARLIIPQVDEMQILSVDDAYRSNSGSHASIRA